MRLELTLDKKLIAKQVDKIMKTLQECRAEIDRIDSELLRLLTERMQVAESVARYKLANELPVFDEVRERAVLDKIAAKTPELLRTELVGTWDGIMNMSKLRQYIVKSELSGGAELPSERSDDDPGRVGVQGVPGSYSTKAASEMYPGKAPSYYNTFADLFNALESNEIDCAVVPLENSIHGTVTGVYHELLTHECTIVKAHPVGISHCLLAIPMAEICQIRRVISHEQALGQCANYIKKHNFEAQAVVNTAAAAKMIRDLNDPTQAAIASAECAQLYGLKIIEQDIQDSKRNLTRFGAVRRERAVVKGANKVSISFTLAHREGTLARVLAYFSALGLNLTKIESSPIPEKPFEYRFYLDFVGNLADSATSELITALSKEMSGFRIFGNYCEE